MTLAREGPRLHMLQQCFYETCSHVTLRCSMLRRENDSCSETSIFISISSLNILLGYVHLLWQNPPCLWSPPKGIQEIRWSRSQSKIPKVLPLNTYLRLRLVRVLPSVRGQLPKWEDVICPATNFCSHCLLQINYGNEKIQCVDYWRYLEWWIELLHRLGGLRISVVLCLCATCRKEYLICLLDSIQSISFFSMTS